MLQKRAIRLITSSHYSSNTSSLFSELNTLSLYDIYKYQMGSFMYKIYHNSLPPKFCNLFQLNSSFHNHFTRHCNDYHLHSVNSIINKRSFVFTGIQFWNNLEPSLKKAKTVTTFDKQLKRFLISSNH